MAAAAVCWALVCWNPFFQGGQTEVMASNKMIAKESSAYFIFSGLFSCNHIWEKSYITFPLFSDISLHSKQLFVHDVQVYVAVAFQIKSF